MADLLVIVPSKRRRANAVRLVKAIRETAAEPVDIAFVICEREVRRYEKALEGYAPITIVPVADDATYPGKLNIGAEQLADGYQYLALLNDDHEPITPGWDVLMKQALADDAFGVAYGPDGVWENGEVPTAPMITSSMQAALGWVALPGLHHILVDNVWMDLATDMGTLHFLPEVRIQHHHRQLGAQNDATYRETNDNDKNMDEDRERYFGWVESEEKQANLAALRGLG